MGDGSRVAGGGKARSSLRPPPSTHHPSPEEIARLVEAHEGLVWWVGQRYWRFEYWRCQIGQRISDFADAGRPGLFYAARRWDPHRGKFSTYAKYWIRFCIREQARRQCAIILPYHVWKKRPRSAEPVQSLDLYLTTSNWQETDELRDRSRTERNDAIERLADLLNSGHLDDRQRLALRLRYGLDGEGAHTFDAIGARLGLSGERARQIVAGAVASLRERF